ncbi:MAG: TatD family hydrolase, partial [Candidatus Binatia bacterium]
MSLVDTHCHLSNRAFRDDLDVVIARAREAGVERIVAVGGGGPIADSER